MASAVVLFKPDPEVWDRVKTYLPFHSREEDVENGRGGMGRHRMGKLYAIDNSDQSFAWVKKVFGTDKRVWYHACGKNSGIAAALNIAAQKAIKDGADWLLTMDQDSCFEKDNLFRLLNTLERVDSTKVGMVCAKYTPKERYVIRRQNMVNEMLVCITSGCLLNLNAYLQAGPFMEKLFIDQVDHEYCLRLKNKGFKVIQVRDAFVRHHLGDPQNHFFFDSSHHNPLRRYFITRNRIYVANLYKTDHPRFYWTEMGRSMVEFLKILLVEDRKTEKLKAMALGYLDYRHGLFDRDLVTIQRALDRSGGK